jgi:D-glycero-D-manno-heptose 1,7-bisphosphate phosphatase
VVANKSAIFLDRDGVINICKVVNGKPYAPRSYKKFKLFDHTLTSLKKIKNMGFLSIIITNQPDIGNKKVKINEIEKMHSKLYETKLIDKIYVCPHSQSENCICRKPSPYLLFKAKKDLAINLKNSWMIGDRYSDIQAGENAGLNTIFIDRKYNETVYDLINCKTVYSLIEAVTFIEDIYSRGENDV